MAKAPAIEELLNKLAPYGRSADHCATCGSDKVKLDTDFRDELSKKEFTISFMCQACQDSVFGGED